MDTCIFSISAVQRRRSSAALALVFAAMAALAALILAAHRRSRPPRGASAASSPSPAAQPFEPAAAHSSAEFVSLAFPHAPRRRSSSAARLRSTRMRCRPARTRSGCTVSRAASVRLRAYRMIRPRIAWITIVVRARDSGISVERVRRAMFEKSARTLFYPDADIATAHALVIAFPSTVNEPGAHPTPLEAVLGSALSPIGEV